MTATGPADDSAADDGVARVGAAQVGVAHVSVLLDEAVAGLAIRADGRYVDGTFGRGGHSRLILSRLGPEGRLLGLDRDPQAVAEGQRLQAEDARFEMAHAPFATLDTVLERQGWAGKVDGLLLDLGVSSPQLDQAGRGFSFMAEGPLDMRMDTSSGVTAAQWLTVVKEDELVRVLREYGEERFARRIAAAVVRERQQSALTTTAQLAELISKAVPVREKHKHPATRSFQAIRIALNAELEQLQQVLPKAVMMLAPGGRLAVISFHSLEDRIVKQFMRLEEKGESLPRDLPIRVQHRPKLVTVGKATMPGDAEVQRNPRARSAVLRVARRTDM